MAGRNFATGGPKAAAGAAAALRAPAVGRAEGARGHRARAGQRPGFAADGRTHGRTRRVHARAGAGD